MNRDLAAMLADLARGRPSPLAVSISKYKPDPESEAESALRDLDTSITGLEAALADPAATRRSTATHAYPWFGPLSATVWASFGSFHQALHLRQATAIVAGSDRSAR